jgi:hypothetical protein
MVNKGMTMSYATVAAEPYSPPVLPPSAAKTPAASNTSSGAASSSTSSSDSSGPTLWSHGSFSFKDLLDIVNPLQHIPVVGSVYRYLTGDEPSGGARIVGDSIYGGPIGFGVSVVSTAFLTDAKGEDLGERLLADVFGPRNDGPTLGTPALASNAPATPNSATAAASATAVRQGAASPLTTQPVAQPVAMNNLFRSLPPNTPGTPEQNFLAQTAQFQRQISTGRGANGAVINNRPVPLELSSNLLPQVPAGAHIVMPPSAAAPGPANPAASATSQAPALPAAPTATTAIANPNPIAQKMLDALDKYEQLKRQEDQLHSSDPNDPPKVDLAL